LDKRTLTQIIASIITNANLQGFISGRIYRGKIKSLCVPGLNCYSCPGALGSCPIGSLQAVIGTAKYNISLYVLGLMGIFGILFGRFICGWLCPFGFIQDLLHKIPSPKFKVPVKLNGTLKYFKYVVLSVFVVLLPLLLVDQLGLSSPYFCKYICPAGTLEGGIPLTLINRGLRAALGFLFIWKLVILLIVIVLSLLIYRPFCRYICPLGAFYALFNPFSYYGYKLDKEKCTGCGVCQNSCRLGLNPGETPNNPECIRCGECLKSCPQGAITRR